VQLELDLLLQPEVVEREVHDEQSGHGLDDAKVL